MNDKVFYAGIDIGGTKISVLLTDAKGKILARGKKKSKAEKGFEEVMQRTRSCVEDACAELSINIKDIKAAGVGAPSPILDNGTAIKAPNMGWLNVPLVPTLKKLLGIPVYAENDCNAGVYGEYALGSGKNSGTLIGLFMGTGLGGGLMINGNLITGENRMAAEIGHITVVKDGRPCGCGKRGCLEAYASKTGMGYRFKQEIFCEKRPSILSEITKNNFDNVKSSLLKQAYTEKDAVTVETLKEAAEFLGLGIGNLITLLGPDMVVVGGGVFDALGKELLPIVKNTAKEYSYPRDSYKDTKITLASLGDDAVALGAMAYAHTMIDKS